MLEARSAKLLSERNNDDQSMAVFWRPVCFACKAEATCSIALGSWKVTTNPMNESSSGGTCSPTPWLEAASSTTKGVTPTRLDVAPPSADAAGRFMAIVGVAPPSADAARRFLAIVGKIGNEEGTRPGGWAGDRLLSRNGKGAGTLQSTAYFI